MYGMQGILYIPRKFAKARERDFIFFRVVGVVWRLMNELAIDC
jgi:hypothetical protein